MEFHYERRIGDSIPDGSTQTFCSMAKIYLFFKTHLEKSYFNIHFCFLAAEVTIIIYFPSFSPSCVQILFYKYLKGYLYWEGARDVRYSGQRIRSNRRFNGTCKLVSQLSSTMSYQYFFKELYKSFCRRKNPIMEFFRRLLEFCSSEVNVYTVVVLLNMV